MTELRRPTVDASLNPFLPGFTFVDQRSSEVRSTQELLMTYRDRLRDAQPRPDIANPGKLLPLTSKQRGLFKDAREISARLRTQGERLAHGDADFLTRSLGLFTAEEMPFRTATLLRDSRIETIDNRYGGEDLLEARTIKEGLQALMDIGLGRNEGRRDMRNRSVPMTEVIQLLAEHVSPEDAVDRAGAIFAARARRYADAIGSIQDVEAFAMTDVLTVLGEVPHISATEYLLLVTRYAMDHDMPWLRAESVNALVGSVKTTMASVPYDKRSEYLFALRSLSHDLSSTEQKLLDGAIHQAQHII